MWTILLNYAAACVAISILVTMSECLAETWRMRLYADPISRTPSH
jgi:hypothetical protein